ncbi:hypothetical protein BGY98DRAFT_1179171 [Russula aff. rugulosa BPL654]|nr:hypothetical protein BGY98DRAFT_1179171 [Russula aff. rugulosa BPL654]
MAISNGSNIAGPGGAAAEQWIEEGHGQGMITVAVKTLQNEGLPGDSRMRIPSLLSSGTTVTDMKIRLLMFQVRIEREKYRRHIIEGMKLKRLRFISPSVLLVVGYAYCTNLSSDLVSLHLVPIERETTFASAGIKPKLYYELPQQEFAANPIPKEKQFAVESTYPN